MIVVDLEQRTEPWYQERLGKATASNASKIITNAGKPSKQQMSYIYELAAERITGVHENGYESPPMINGAAREGESLKLYELIRDARVRRVGVIYRDRQKQCLCSPDGIVKNQRGLEVKNVLAKTQAKRLFENVLPEEYFSQIQFSLWVTGFKTWDFMSYCPGLKPLIISVKRDEKFIRALSAEMKKFCQTVEKITRKIR